jgi:hypothetical protein
MASLAGTLRKQTIDLKHFYKFGTLLAIALAEK